MAEQSTSVSGPNHRVRLRPLRWWWVGASAALVIGMGLGLGSWLWLESDGLPLAASVQAHEDAVRTALTAAGGTGAALALLLAVRRQRSTEIALDLRDIDLALKAKAAAATESDATERRITELYAKAVEQLGSDKAPVRLGGLHALERLAQDNESHRQTIVDVICAYLRMPYTPPPGRYQRQRDDELGAQDDHEAETSQSTTIDRAEVERRTQERQVRQTAQRILTSHLRPDMNASGQSTNPKYWPSIVLDLTGAYLIDLNLSYCYIEEFNCNRATLAGETLAKNTVFGWMFAQSTRFVHDTTHDTFAADFRGAQFNLDAWFSFSTFAGQPWFHADEFFSGTHFFGRASFKGVRFGSGARFDRASFNVAVDLSEARTQVAATSQNHWPDGWQEEPLRGVQRRRKSDTSWVNIIPTNDPPA